MSDRYSGTSLVERKGNYKVFAVNRVKRILEKELTEWKYAPVKENPADIGDRVSTMGRLP